MKKAFILTFDMGLAALLVIGILAISTHYSSVIKRDLWQKNQMVSISQDAIALLDYEGVLQTQNTDLIYEKISELLGNEYNIELYIEEYEYANGFKLTNTYMVKANYSNASIDCYS